MPASMFQEFALTQSQTAAVEDALASIETDKASVQEIRAQVEEIYELIINPGFDDQLSPGEVASLLAAKDDAVAAKDDAETAQTAAVAAQAAAETGKSDAETARDASVVALAGSVAAQAAAEVAQAEAEAELVLTQTARAQAQAAADLGDQFSNAAEDTAVLPGRFSSFHWYEKGRKAAGDGAAFTKVEIVDPAGDEYTLTSDDLFKLLEFDIGTGTDVILPINLWNQLTLLDEPTEAWIRIRRKAGSTGTLTLVPDAVATTQDVQHLTSQIFDYSVEPAVTGITGNHSFVVPAGTNRVCGFIMASIFNSSKTGRNSTLTVASGTTTKRISDTSTQSATLTDPVTIAAWTSVLADSAVATTHALALTPDANPCSYVLFAFACALVGDVQTSYPSAQHSTASQTHTLAVNPDTAQSVIQALITFQGNDALPLTPAFPVTGVSTVSFNAKTPLARALKDLAYVAGRQFTLTTGSRNFAAVSGKTAKGASAALIFRPDAATVTPTLVGSATLTGSGEACTLMVASDGLTYHREA